MKFVVSVEGGLAVYLIIDEIGDADIRTAVDGMEGLLGWLDIVYTVNVDAMMGEVLSVNAIIDVRFQFLDDLRHLVLEKSDLRS